MKKFPPISKDFPHFLHGGDYNPEQWIETPEIWDEDMSLMKEGNLNEFTIGIFSWAEFEKEEGVFDFSWLDTIIEKIPVTHMYHRGNFSERVAPRKQI